MSGAASDRNAGTNAGRIQGQISQIRNWMAGADFEHVPGDDIDRVIAEFDFRAHVDPTLSASANYQRIKDELGLMTATDIKLEARKADDKAEDSARRAIRENLEAIDAGEADDLLADIEAEYGAEFIEAELELARIDAASVETDREKGAPEPNDTYLSSVSSEAPIDADAPEPEPTADESPARETTRESLIPPEADGRPNPYRTPAPVEADSTGSKRVVPTGALKRALAPLRDLYVGFFVLPREHPELFDGGSANV